MKARQGSNSVRIPRAAQYLLTKAFPDLELREAILGDLEEEMQQRRRELGALRAYCWCWQQALGSWAYALRHPPHDAASPRPREENAVSSLIQDLRFSMRTLRRNPAFTATVVLTIGVGIAGSAAIFSIFDSVLLRPLPFPQPEQLVLVGQKSEGGEPSNTGYTTWVDWREQATAFQGLAMIRSWNPTLLDDGAVRLQGVRLTWNALELLGARYALGRGFRAEEDLPDAQRVAVLSHRLWRSRFGADPEVIGGSVQLAGQPYQVVGVLAPSFAPLLSQHLYGEAEIYAPLRYSTELPWACRSCGHTVAFGRLRPGATHDFARNDLQRIHRGLAEQFPLDYETGEVAVLGFHEAMVRNSRPGLKVMLSAVVLLLVMACVNVASLLLARGVERGRELVIRRALGAEPGRLVRQLMTESFLLSLLGAGLGLALAAVAIPLIIRWSPEQVPRLAEASVDLRVLIFALLATLASSLLFGLLPALGLSLHSADGLRSHGQSSSRDRALGRRLLVVTNVALALLLLMGAALTVKSFDRLLHTDPGFTTRGVLTTKLSLLGDRFEEDAVALGIYDQLLERVSGLPGVEAAAISSQMPLGGNWDSWGVQVEGRPHDSASDSVNLQRYSVTPGYFQTLDVPLVAGRLLQPSDTHRAQQVMLLGETSARQIFGHEAAALGQRIRFSDDKGWRTIVGVVGDVQHEGLGSEPLPAMYLPQAQLTDRYVVLSARASDHPEALAWGLRAAIAEAGKDIPVYDLAWLADRAGNSVARERFLALQLAVFAAVACLLAAVGLYGLIAFLVERRRSEVGVRVALGALRRDIALLILRQGGAMVALGLVVGLAFTLAAGPLLRSILHGISPHDPSTYLQVAVGLLLVAVMAHLGPLWRAVNVDPAETLRDD